jgi:hypothetical protein
VFKSPASLLSAPPSKPSDSSKAEAKAGEVSKVMKYKFGPTATVADAFPKVEVLFHKNLALAGFDRNKHQLELFYLGEPLNSLLFFLFCSALLP